MLCGYIMGLGALGADGVGVGMWRWCFWAPALIAGAGLVLLFFTLPGTPEEEGLNISTGLTGLTRLKESNNPVNPVNPVKNASRSATAAQRVYLNPTMWVLGASCFMVYLARFAILDWGQMLMKEAKGVSLAGAGWTVATFEIAGILGTLFSGFATDRLAGGRAPRVCLFMMLGAAAGLAAFWFLPSGSPTLLYILALAFAGFCIYGPQAMTGATAVNLATKRLAGTAVGFTSLFPYASVLVSGCGMGWLTDKTGGWGIPFAAVIGATLLGAGLFLALWNTKPNGYVEEN